MNEPDRPPLHPITCEQIDMLLHEVDERHWPIIAKMKVEKFIAPSTPVHPQTPLLLLHNLNFYATALFTTEADYYEPFRDDGRYPAWLSKLADRVVVRVLGAVDKIEHGNFILGNLISTLSYHGVTAPRMEKSLRDALWDEKNRYTQRNTGPQVQTERASIQATPTPEISAAAIENPSTEPVSKGNRERIDDFIRKMANEGLKINRKHIWQAAGYKDRTEFERFQRGEHRNRSASLNFNRILKLEKEDFSRLIEQSS